MSVGDKGRGILLDLSAESADPDNVAFLARPEGAPVYHGFPVIEESETDGWFIGAITEYLGADEGDAFVVAPDGSRAGLVWEVGDGTFDEICKPESNRWGVFAVWFPNPVQTEADFIDNFPYVLPLLQLKYAELKNR
jgi:hypothetical protein